MSWIGIDVGGTFTDAVVYDAANDELRSEKAPTTPGAPEQGVLAALEMGDDKHEERVRQAEGLLKQSIVKGFKFHPPDQGKQVEILGEGAAAVPRMVEVLEKLELLG